MVGRMPHRRVTGQVCFSYIKGCSWRVGLDLATKLTPTASATVPLHSLFPAVACQTFSSETSSRPGRRNEGSEYRSRVMEIETAIPGALRPVASGAAHPCLAPKRGHSPLWRWRQSPAIPRKSASVESWTHQCSPSKGKGHGWKPDPAELAFAPGRSQSILHRVPNIYASSRHFRNNISHRSPTSADSPRL